VALGDGWAAVGAPFAPVGGRAEQGMAHLYVLQSDDTWVCATSLVADAGAAYDRFGQALAASGNRLAVGAWGDDQKGAEAGAVHLFETDGTNWIWRAKLTASDGAAGHQFGWAVALDGDRLAVGARKAPKGSATASGAVYLFEKQTEGSWTEKQKLQPADAASYDYFGCAVALDGDELLVGANDNDDKGSKSGSAYLFRFDRGGTQRWVQSALLLDADGAQYDLLGSSAALRGGIAAVGAPGAFSAAGAVCLYARDEGGSNAWGRVAKVAPAELPAGIGFGASVTLTQDRLFIGAPDAALSGPLAAGAVYLYEQTGADWKQVQLVQSARPQESERFGASLAVNGTWLAVGAPGCTNAGVAAGEARLYRQQAAATAFTALVPHGGLFVLSWSGSTDRTQILQRTTSLQPPEWIPVKTNLPPVPAMGVHTGAWTGTRAFYRIIEL